MFINVLTALCLQSVKSKEFTLPSQALKLLKLYIVMTSWIAQMSSVVSTRASALAGIQLQVCWVCRWVVQVANTQRYSWMFCCKLRVALRAAEYCAVLLLMLCNPWLGLAWVRPCAPWNFNRILGNILLIPAYFPPFLWEKYQSASFWHHDEV